ncbi:hypothetical protein TRVL_07182 [Trypanosoma vivax]|nr:hypothetical protein TRVL_07182 [Trypanosoma vivax]
MRTLGFQPETVSHRTYTSRALLRRRPNERAPPRSPAHALLLSHSLFFSFFYPITRFFPSFLLFYNNFVYDRGVKVKTKETDIAMVDRIQLASPTKGGKQGEGPALCECFEVCDGMWWTGPSCINDVLSDVATPP